MDIEKKALELVMAEVHEPYTVQGFNRDHPYGDALCRAIEAHEAFRREVSEELTAWFDSYRAEVPPQFRRFIIPQPDPLVEVMQEWWDADGYASIETFRAALAARGLEIVKKEPSQ